MITYNSFNTWTSTCVRSSLWYFKSWDPQSLLGSKLFNSNTQNYCQFLGPSLYHLLQVGTSGCYHGVWCIVCILVINICGREEEEAQLGRGRSQTLKFFQTLAKYNGISEQIHPSHQNWLDIDCLRKGLLLSKMAHCQWKGLRDMKLSSECTTSSWSNKTFIKRDLTSSSC